MATISEILQRSRQVLATARHGLDTARREPAHRVAGLHNAIVFGRSVTFVLQNLRSIEPDFDEWYEEHAAGMRQDPLMRFFVDLRNKIEKQGLMPTQGYAHVKEFEYPKDLAKLGPRPPGAMGFFIGDELGGSGWVIRIAEGAAEKLYVEFPAEVGKAGLAFTSAPGLAAGAAPSEADALRLTEEYLARVERILALAEGRFGARVGHARDV